MMDGFEVFEVAGGCANGVEPLWAETAVRAQESPPPTEVDESLVQMQHEIEVQSEIAAAVGILASLHLNLEEVSCLLRLLGAIECGCILNTTFCCVCAATRPLPAPSPAALFLDRVEVAQSLLLCLPASARERLLPALTRRFLAMAALKSA